MAQQQERVIKAPGIGQIRHRRWRALRYWAPRGLPLLLLLVASPAASPDVLETSLRHIDDILFGTQIDRSGNSTGLLMASALVSLGWLRDGPTLRPLVALLCLGIAAGAGATGV